MDEKEYALLGMLGPLLAYVFIAVSIALSPWFSWWRNALSDLGHATHSNVASIFNFGLLLAGLLITVYAVAVFRKYAKYTSVCVVASAFTLQLVAAFNETYVPLHYVASVLFFVLLGVSSVVYTIEKRSFLALGALAVGLASWALYWYGVYKAGIAVPEAISSIAAISWIAVSAYKIYSGKKPVETSTEKKQ